MKLIHISDLHLGRKLNQYSLYEEQKEALNEVLAAIKKYQVDVLMISGDIYDTIRPSKESINLYSDFIEQVTQYCSVVAISGNHDNDAMHQAHKSLLKNGRYYIAGKSEIPLEKITLFDEEGPVNFYLFPYTSVAQAEMLVKDDDTKFKNDQEAIDYILSHTTIDTALRNIILFHGFVVGTSEALLSQSERENTIGTAQAIASSSFKDFDYVALGHLHRAQSVNQSNMYYSGSIYGYSESEIGYSKGMILVEFNDKKSLSTEFLPFHPKRNLRKIKAYAKDLEQENESDDFLFIELKDKTPVPRLQKWLSERFNHLVTISQPMQYEATVNDEQQFDFELGLIEQIKKYYELVNQEEMDNELYHLLESSFKELEEE